MSLTRLPPNQGPHCRTRIVAGSVGSILKNKNLTLDPDWTPTQKAGVRLVACAMSMDLLGIKGEELIEGVEIGGVAAHLDHAQSGNVNLFI